VTIVGLFNFQVVGAYSLAATLILFFTGFERRRIFRNDDSVAVLQTRHEVLPYPPACFSSRPA